MKTKPLPILSGSLAEDPDQRNGHRDVRDPGGHWVREANPPSGLVRLTLEVQVPAHRVAEVRAALQGDSPAVTIHPGRPDLRPEWPT